MALILLFYYLFFLSLAGAAVYLMSGRYLNGRLSGEAKRVILTAARVIQLTLLVHIMTVLLFSFKGTDPFGPDVYSDTVIGVIRGYFAAEVIVSVILLMINRKKNTMAVLILCNLFSVYKFISTF